MSAEDHVVDLMKALEDSIAAAKAERAKRHGPVGFDADGRPLDCVVDGEPWPCSTSRAQP